MPVGSGRLEMSAILRPDAVRGQIDLERRLRQSTSLFASAWGGADRAATGDWRVSYGAIGGLRVTF